VSTYREVELSFIRRDESEENDDWLAMELERATETSELRAYPGGNVIMADYGVLAKHNEKVVGVVCVRDCRKPGADEGLLRSCGSWVAPEWRQKGLAVRMWRLMLRRTKAEEVSITVITDRGLTLADALRRKIRGVRFNIIESGNRNLRNLSKKGKGS